MQARFTPWGRPRNFSAAHRLCCMRSDWQPIYTASESSTGAKAHTEKAKASARSALQRELFLNLLALAQNFPEQPEMLKVFMQPSLLK